MGADEAERIDELVSSAAVGWELDRMPVVDRTILRLATWELLARPDVPVAVVIDEAVELAKQYSTEQSGGFVNGVLAARPSPVERPAGITLIGRRSWPGATVSPNREAGPERPGRNLEEPEWPKENAG